MYIIENGKFYKKELVELTNEEILGLLNSKQEKKLELEDFNFKVNSSNWEIKEIGGEKVKVNPEGDITEFLEGEYKGEQLFTWNACMRETKLRNKRVPTDEEFNILLKTKDDLKNLTLAGYRFSVTFYHRGLNAYLWSSTQFDATNARGRNLCYGNAEVYRRNWNKSTYGFSVRCIKD